MKITDEIAHRLLLRVSTIPNAGVGIFTGTDLPFGVPVCEYKGDVFAKDVNAIPSADTPGNPRRFPDKKKEIRYNFTLTGSHCQFEDRQYEYMLSHPLTGENIDSHPALCESEIGLGGFVNDTRTWEGRIKEEEVHQEGEGKAVAGSRSLEQKLKEH